MAVTIFTDTVHSKLGSAAMPRAPITSARARVAAWPMSPLVTVTMSGISTMPAFMNCRLSPEPGCTQKTTVSAAMEMSVSDWPTPTVSTSTMSKTARISTMAPKVISARPPSWSRAAMERMKVFWSSGSVRSRTRSPSSAPPVRREEGSTAMTPMLLPCAR